MTSQIALLGLPGLYQNWLQSVLGAPAATILEGNHNFVTHTLSNTWFKKIDFDLSGIPDLTSKYNFVVNTYVTEQNFVWYLYNFLEKTDNVGIFVDNFVEDLFTKSRGTVAFDGLLNYLITSYQLNDKHDHQYIFNAAVENFYLLLIDQVSKFKTQSYYTNPSLINIEYRDFENFKLFDSKINQLPGYDRNHTEASYSQLVNRNTRFLTKQQTFISKLKSGNNEFDILELAYIGWLLWKLTPERLDWFNEKIRNESIQNHYNELCSLADLYYNNSI